MNINYLYRTVTHSVLPVLYCTVLYFTVLYYATLHYTIPLYTTLRHTTLPCILTWCTVRAVRAYLPPGPHLPILQTQRLTPGFESFRRLRKFLRKKGKRKKRIEKKGIQKNIEERFYTQFAIWLRNMSICKDATHESHPTSALHTSFVQYSTENNMNAVANSAFSQLGKISTKCE